MSDNRAKPPNPVNNEEVINELTKDLQSSMIVGDNPEEIVINPGSSQEDAVLFDGDTTKHVLDSNSETEIKYGQDSEEEKEEENSDIDEVSLKDAELALTDDQKAERKLIAEELKNAGNQAFKVGEFEKSIEKYTEGLRICPLQFSQQRSILYCNRSAAKMKLENYAKAVKDCTKAIELDEKYLKAYLRRAQSYEASEKFDEALGDYKKILEFDPSHKDAQKALIRLPPLIEEKNEKLKTEMLGKLKDLGNMILKPFGLSTENFQLEQDPESKGYKINFKQ